MKLRPIDDQIGAVGAVDFDRRMFDALIPLPDGTSYNAYLLKGSQKTALVDSVDPAFSYVLMDNLRDVPVLDYVVSNHAEQDHSGTIPLVLEKYPRAVLLCSPKAKPMLQDHLGIAADRIQIVEDGSTLSLGDLTLEFISTPWVHWPETMGTFVREKGLLFSGDFFGAHVAQSELFVEDDKLIYDAAKRYFAEIMMPFRTAIQKNLERLSRYDIKMIAPSHGPVHCRPEFIQREYREWVSDQPANAAVVAYVSMHGSTSIMVRRLVAALADRGVRVSQFDLADTDSGKLAMALVDAATVILAGPAIHIGLHPKVANAAFLANAIRPKARFASYVGSYGWGHKLIEQLQSLLVNLKVEYIPPVICKGLPREADLAAVEALAEAVAAKHAAAGCDDTTCR
jgi:flavorubredoxin